MAIQQYLPSSDSIDAATHAALSNQVTYEWGTITLEETRKKLQTHQSRSDFVDRFLKRTDAHKDLPNSSLDRNYLLAQVALL